MSPTPAPRGISMSFIQQRIEEGTDRAQVRIVNGTPRPLRVREVGLRWPGYPPDVQAARASVQPGATLDLRYVLPPPRCGTDAETVRPVGVESVQGSVLFELAMPGRRTLPGRRRSVALPLDLAAGRCDEHARSQSTQTFTFRFGVRLGAAEPVVVVAEPGPRLQRDLLAFLDRACAARGDSVEP